MDGEVHLHFLKSTSFLCCAGIGLKVQKAPLHKAVHTHKGIWTYGGGRNTPIQASRQTAGGPTMVWGLPLVWNNHLAQALGEDLVQDPAPCWAATLSTLRRFIRPSKVTCLCLRVATRARFRSRFFTLPRLSKSVETELPAGFNWILESNEKTNPWKLFKDLFDSYRLQKESTSSFESVWIHYWKQTII